MAKNKGELTPQQTIFLQSYMDPKSPTFSNARQSALKAGYKQEYADNITSIMPEWLSENIGLQVKINKANRNLDMALDGLLDDPERGKKEIQYKATEFIQKTLNKKIYSERLEITGENGEPIKIIFDESFKNR